MTSILRILAPAKVAVAALSIAALGAGTLAAPPAQAAVASGGPIQVSMTKNSLLSARVPSMCGHPAGRLVNGKLPGVNPYYGGVWLAKGRTAIGKVQPGKKAGAVAVFDCNQGGVPWSEHVVFYSAAKKVIGHIDLGRVTGARSMVRNVSVSKKGVITINVVGIAQRDEPYCCGTKSAQLAYKWSTSKKRFVRTKRAFFTERTAAAKLVKQLNKKSTKGAKKYATSSVARQMRANTKYSLLGSCESGQPFSTNRMCTVNFRIAKGICGNATVAMKKTSWSGWKAVGFYPNYEYRCSR